MFNMRFLKVQNEKGLIRDTESGAIIHSDQFEYQNYLKRRQHVINAENKEKHLNNEINNLKQEVNEIKDLLKTLIGQISQNGNTK